MRLTMFAEQIRQSHISYRRSYLTTPGGEMVGGRLLSLPKR